MNAPTSFLKMQLEEEDFFKHRKLAKSCWFLTGATAGGKSEISDRIADQLSKAKRDVEIISMDSMAIYRDMNIGTAKPSCEIRKRIPHHMVDILAPTEDFSVSDYCRQSLQLASEIKSSGKEVLFVGGTALYLKTLLRGAFEGPPADWEFRNAVLEEIKSTGPEVLHQRLQYVDPLSAHKFHPNDTRRILRALEVYKITGQPISHLQTQFETETPAKDNNVFAIRWPREILHQRIDDRVESMFDEGFVDEVEGLVATHGELGKTASQAVGYQEVLEHLETDSEIAHVKELVKNRTHQFARHQETWFRGLSEVTWIDRKIDDSVDEIVNQIISQTDQRI